MIQYICKYSPTELYEGFGCELTIPNGEVPDFSWADTVVHPNLCTHAKQLLTASRGAEELVLVNCCDSVRRVADTLSLTGAPAYLELLDLPHESGGCMVDSFANQLIRVKETYAGYSGRSFSRDRFLSAWRRASDEWAEKMRALCAEPHLILLGARAGDGLMKTIREAMPLPVYDLTCSGLRNLAPPPEGAEEMEEGELIRAYAAAILSQIPCMRMKVTEPRNWMTEGPDLAGIIYNTVRFCDYYEFDYASVRKRTQVPILKIETDYTAGTRGQLSTRLAAFAEQMEGERAATCACAGAAIRRMDLTTEKDRRERMEGAVFLGIDSGSTTTNAAAIDSDGKLLAFSVVRTGAKSLPAAEKALGEICEKLRMSREDFARICATGYGREYLTFADSTKTEITCHARGAFFLDPDVRTIVDIGGQDSKVICLDDNGNVINFVMNDKCAAGTGRFFEMMARTLEMDIDEMASLGARWKKDLTITSTCTVFAESEVISLIAENRDTADIVHGLNKAVAAKAAGMVQRAQGAPPFMMTGGVAKNGPLAKALEEKLGSPLFIPEHPDLAGAIGAALFAREEGSL